MRERKGWRVGLLLAAAGGAGAFALLATAVWAQASPAVSIGSGEAAPGDQVAVELNSHDVGDPGLGAWSIDVTYDPEVVRPLQCVTEHGAVCNTAFDDDTVRTAGATAEGIVGDTLLATITFECLDAEGESDLTVSLPDFADATIGGPEQIDAAIENGSITCAEETVAATATPGAPPAPGNVGSGPGSNDGTSFAWLIASLVGAGAIAGAAGFVALRRGTTRA
jgi:hypothetical protein